MFKLPVCPYCNTVYDYKEVRRNKKKIIKCYHCKNEFKKSNIKGYSVLAFIIVFTAVLINFVILNLTAAFIKTIIPITAVSIIAVLIFIILCPFFIEYKEIKGIKLKDIPSESIADLKEEKTETKKLKRSLKNRNRKNKK